MKANPLTHYGSIGVLAMAAIVFGNGARHVYSAKQVDKDAEQLSVPLNDTHHIEIHPDVYVSAKNETHNFSRVRIAANDAIRNSYSYNITRRTIEGYELAPDQLPVFLQDKKSLAAVHAKACDALAQYAPTTPSFITDEATARIQKRKESVEYLQRNFCS